jgi:hypothetical protein
MSIAKVMSLTEYRAWGRIGREGVKGDFTMGGENV